VPLRSSTGATAYIDLLHRASSNAVEVDGWATHSRRHRFMADRRRDRWVRREHGITTTRVAADEVAQRLGGVVAELLPLLR
jgi:very-short-patch-repair endonuclease